MTTVWADGGCSGNGTNHCKTYGSFKLSTEPFPHRVEFQAGSNNEAEYETLIRALKFCIEQRVEEPEIFMDSRLVVSQVNGQWKINGARLRQLCQQARSLLLESSGTLKWIPRDYIVAQLGH